MIEIQISITESNDVTTQGCFDEDLKEFKLTATYNGKSIPIASVINNAYIITPNGQEWCINMGGGTVHIPINDPWSCSLKYRRTGVTNVELAPDVSSALGFSSHIISLEELKDRYKEPYYGSLLNGIKVYKCTFTETNLLNKISLASYPHDELLELI